MYIWHGNRSEGEQTEVRGASADKWEYRAWGNSFNAQYMNL